MRQRRRHSNFHQPHEEIVDDSVTKLVNEARLAAERDHHTTFSSARERDLIASVYLQRACDRMRDQIDGEEARWAARVKDSD